MRWREEKKEKEEERREKNLKNNMIKSVIQPTAESNFRFATPDFSLYNLIIINLEHQNALL